MKEFRAVIADSVVLSLVNNGSLSPGEMVDKKPLTKVVGVTV